eukprot:gene7388-8799_t
MGGGERWHHCEDEQRRNKLDVAKQRHDLRAAASAGERVSSVGPEADQNLEALSSTEVWAVGDATAILHTTDGGSTWEYSSMGRDIVLYSVFFVSSSTGWATGDGGRVYHTSDGAAYWEVQPVDTDQALHGVYFVSATRGWVVGYNGVVLSTSSAGSDDEFEMVWIVVIVLAGLLGAGAVLAWYVYTFIVEQEKARAELARQKQVMLALEAAKLAALPAPGDEEDEEMLYLEA